MRKFIKHADTETLIVYIISIALIGLIIGAIIYSELGKRTLRQTQSDKMEAAAEASRLHKSRGLRAIQPMPDGGFRVVVDGGSFIADSNVRIGDLWR